MTQHNRYVSTAFSLEGVRFSPDTRFVAYISVESGRNEVYVQPFPASSQGKWMVSKGGGTQAVWRRDGKQLFYISPDSKVMAVEVTISPEFKAGIPKALFSAPVYGGGDHRLGHRYDVTADGTRFLITTLSQEASPITVVLNWTK